MSFEGDVVASVQVLAGGPDQFQDAVPRKGKKERSEKIKNSDAKSMFQQFIDEFKDLGQFIVRDQLTRNFTEGKFYLDIDMRQLASFAPKLSDALQDHPDEYIPDCELAAKEFIERNNPSDRVPQIQVRLGGYKSEHTVRTLGKEQREHLGFLVSVSGIIVSASRPRVKVVERSVICRNCRTVKHVLSGPGFGSADIPRKCDTAPRDGAPKCPLDPFITLVKDSKTINVEVLKLQEIPESVPTGEMPRQMMLLCERTLVGHVKPGTRATIVGISSNFSPKQGGADQRGNTVSDVGIQIPYIRVLGIEQGSTSNEIMQGHVTQESEEEMRKLVRNTPNLYEAIASSIAPAIKGKEDIKKAIACSLFGGSAKDLGKGTRLRGDINVLLLGDPSVAKSQFLKFAAQVAPIAVYTSGKGSSAAGLTASVIRDPTSGEFHLEAGALVLADGGLVCIDEFDKMRDQDRVAIHEAMEQQTISIAKAGISATLNSRTSVIAAANPVFGRYDDMKSATDNIDFQATILSRFDLIFIIRDLQDEVLDQELARHIVNVHRKMDDIHIEAGPNIIPVDKLKTLISYARHTFQPRLSDRALDVLESRYVAFRQEVAKRRREERQQQASAANRFNSSGSAEVIPITVRQLEAIIRLSESLAKMELKTEVTPDHVEEALRLFKVATMQAATSPFGDLAGSPQFEAKLKAAERYIESHMVYGQVMATRQLLRDLIAAGHDENAGRKALQALVDRRAFTFEKQRKMVKRLMRA